MQLSGDVDTLGAMGAALAAADAMGRLTQLGYAPVVSHEIGAAGLAVLRVGGGLGDVALIEAFVVMQQYRWDVQTVGARHAVLAVVAGDGVELHHPRGGILQELELLVRQGIEGTIGPEVVLQVLHPGHPAQDGQHSRQAAGEAECPRGHAALRVTLLELGHDIVRHVGEAAAQERFHDNGRYPPFGQSIVKVLGIGVAGIDLLGVLPVEIVELDLHEIPLVDIVPLQEPVETLHVPW